MKKKHHFERLRQQICAEIVRHIGGLPTSTDNLTSSLGISHEEIQCDGCQIYRQPCQSTCYRYAHNGGLGCQFVNTLKKPIYVSVMSRWQPWLVGCHEVVRVKSIPKRNRRNQGVRGRRSESDFRILVENFLAITKTSNQGAPNKLQDVNLADSYQSNPKGSYRSKSGVLNLIGKSRKMAKVKSTATAAKKAFGLVANGTSNKKPSFIDWIEEDLLELSYKIDHENRTFVNTIGKQMTFESIATDIEANRDIQEKARIGRTRIMNGLGRIIERNQEKIFAETMKAISYNPKSIDRFDDIGRIICGPDSREDEKKFTPLLLRYLVWSIKRRMSGHRVDNPLLLNIYGRGGVGKSRFLEQLLSPIPRSFWMSCSHGNTLINDERWARAFGDYFAIVLDELGGVKNADLEKLKNTIDTPFLTHRVMRSNSVSRVPNRAQLVGTSNGRLRNNLSADENVRKYAEIDFVSYSDSNEQENMVWEPLNGLDWISLWRSVDETSDQSPMVSVWSEFVIWTSNKCVKQTEVNIWWTQFLDMHEGENLQESKILESLNEFYEKHNVEKKVRKGKDALGTMLIAAGATPIRPNGNGNSYKLPLKKQSRLYIRDLDLDLVEKELE